MVIMMERSFRSTMTIKIIALTQPGAFNHGKEICDAMHKTIDLNVIGMEEIAA